MAFVQRQAHDNIIAVAFHIAEPPGILSGQRQPQGAARRAWRDTEQGGLITVQPKVKTRRVHGHRIAHIARARHVTHHGFRFGGQTFQHIQFRANDAHLDRRVDGRAVLEDSHHILRVRCCRQLGPQSLHQRRTALLVPTLQHHQHFADVAALIETALVIEDLRVTAADVAHHRLHLGFAFQGIFNHVNGAGGRGNCGAFARRHLHQEIGRFRRRKQAGANQRHQAKTRDDQKCRNAHRPPRMGEAPVQHRLIEAVDALVHCLQEGIAVLAFLARQDAAGQERHDGERHEQRRSHRAQHGHRQAACELASAFREHGQRQKSKQQHEGTADHGHRNLAGAVDGGLLPRFAHAQMAGDILRDHDAVVHQQAKRDDEAGNRQLVEREPAPAQHGHTHGEAQRHRDHHHDARPPTKRQQSDQHQAQRDGEILAQLAQLAGDVIALIKAHHHLHIGRQLAAVRVRRLYCRIADIEHIEPILLGQRHPHRALVIVTAEVRLLLIGPADLCNILHPHDAAILRTHRFIRQFVDRLVGAAGLHVQPSIARLHCTGRQILAAAAQRIRNGSNGNAQLRHAPGIQRHPHLGLRQRPHPRCPHARHPDQPLAQVLGNLFQPTIARCVRDQGELQNGRFGGAGLLKFQARQR